MRYSYKQALVELAEYAKGEGYNDISYNHPSISTINWVRSSLNVPKFIHIEGKHTLENKTYLMLHELGHHLLRKSWDKFEKRFPIAAYAEAAATEMKDWRYRRRVDYAVASLEEEFLAWEEGLKLGVKMGIRINFDKYIALKTKCLKQYISYYASLRK